MYKVLIILTITILSSKAFSCEKGSYIGNIKTAKELENKDLDCHYNGKESTNSGLDIFMPRCPEGKPTVYLYGFGGEQFEITSIKSKIIRGVAKHTTQYSLEHTKSGSPITCKISNDNANEDDFAGGDITEKTYGVFCNIREYYKKTTGKNFESLENDEKQELKETTAAFHGFLKNLGKEEDDIMGTIMACSVVNKVKSEMLSSGCKDSEGNEASVKDIKQAVKYCANQR